MKIYKIWQTVNNDYDTYDGFVVYANNEDEAKQIQPLNIENDIHYRTDWVNKVEDIQIEYLGEAKEDADVGIILSSFNAG